PQLKEFKFIPVEFEPPPQRPLNPRQINRIMKRREARKKIGNRIRATRKK
ncbi:9840_t:CDS:1, partial [Funneliformis mosseae]